MSIYNYSVLKSNPVKVCIPLENGLAPEVKVYRVKWHGKDVLLEWGEKVPFQEPWDCCTFDLIRRRAEWAWKGETPVYIINTAGYEGKLDWNDPHYKEHGFQIFECSFTAFQEDEGFRKHVGTLFKRGRGKYEFIPKDPEQDSRVVL